MKKALVIIGAVFVLFSLVYAWDTYQDILYDKTDGSATWTIQGITETDSTAWLDTKNFRYLSVQYKAVRGVPADDSLDMYLVLCRMISGGWVRAESVLISDTLWRISDFATPLKCPKTKLLLRGTLGNDVNNANTLTGSFFLQE